MAAERKIDGIDRRILEMMIENARVTYTEIGRQIGITSAAVQQRVLKLEEAKIIAGAHIEINSKALGYNTCAFVGVYLERAGLYTQVLQELKKIPEVVECHYTTGNYALFIKIYCRNNEDLMRVLNGTVQQIDGVSSTETIISLQEPFKREVALPK